jgi:hypothetical protein
MTTAFAVGGLLLGPGGISIAMAQPAPGTAPAPAAAGDPPDRVGRLARLQGTVSFHDGGETQWVAATLNYPVTSGSAFWTQPSAAADIEVGATRVTMYQTTEFDVDALDDTTLAATLAQGAVFLDVNALESGENYQLRTPRGLVTIAQPGRYEVVAGDTEHPTTVTVVDGAATITGDTLNVTVNVRQTAQVTGTDNFQASVGAEQNDAFLVAFLAPPPAAPAPAYTPPQVVMQMTGGDALQETGSWAAAPEYGEVWYPPVQAGWGVLRRAITAVGCRLAHAGAGFRWRLASRWVRGRGMGGRSIRRRWSALSGWARAWPWGRRSAPRWAGFRWDRVRRIIRPIT